MTSIVLTTVVGGALLILDIPTVQRLNGWVCPIHGNALVDVKAILPAIIALPLFLLLLCRFEVVSTRWGTACALGGLMLLGLALQYGLALSESRGIDGMRDRMLTTGHAEFARTASWGPSYWRIISRYEQYLHAGSQAYARTKPPGQLLFYMILADVADRVMPPAPHGATPRSLKFISERHRRLVNFAAIVLPVLSVLAVVPIYFVAAAILPRRYALWPPVLYLLTPPVMLVTLHLDQALYPLLASSVWVLSAYAGNSERRAWVWGAAAGGATWVALFVSFSLIPVIPLAACFAWVSAQRSASGSEGRRLVTAAAGYLVTMLALISVAYYAAGYDMARRFEVAMGCHRAWMWSRPGWEDWPEDRWLLLQSSVLNLVEFAYWIGPALLVAFLYRVAADTRSALRATSVRNRGWCLAPLMVVLLAGMAWFGGSVGETARLWVFMIPAVTLSVVYGLARLGIGTQSVVPLVVAVSQLAWVVVLKAKQDFW
ncbi:MAG: hypothetical protein PVI86_06630 [Phycisphaerae bacterium]